MTTWMCRASWWRIGTAGQSHSLRPTYSNPGLVRNPDRGDRCTSPSIDNVLSYVSITKGGFYGGCDLYVTYGDVTVANSQLDGGLKSGVCLDHGATLDHDQTPSSPTTRNMPWMCSTRAPSLPWHNLTATGNMSNTIGIEAGTLYGAHTWWKSGINTYDLHNSYVTVAPTGTLTIEPGVTVLFGYGEDITVNGVLNAIGTPAEPILFSGEVTHPACGLGSTLSARRNSPP